MEYIIFTEENVSVINEKKWRFKLYCVLYYPISNHYTINLKKLYIILINYQPRFKKHKYRWPAIYKDFDGNVVERI